LNDDKFITLPAVILPTSSVGCTNAERTWIWNPDWPSVSDDVTRAIPERIEVTDNNKTSLAATMVHPMTISEEESNLFCAFHLLNPTGARSIAS
jgi:hypothetical protein